MSDSDPHTPTTSVSDVDEALTPVLQRLDRLSIDVSLKSELRRRSERASRWEIDPLSEIIAALETLTVATDRVEAVEDDTMGILQVRDMSHDEVYGRISNILKTSISSDEVTFCLPSRSPAWQRYSKQLGRVVLLKSKIANGIIKHNLFTRTAKSSSLRQVKKANAFFELLRVMRELLESKSRVSKRSMYYTHRSLFETQESCDSLIEDIACYIGCKRDNLPVYPEPKGKIGGMISYTYEGEVFDCRRRQGYFIPQDIARAEIENIGAKCILVVEKHSVFNRLMDEKFFEKVPCILLSGGGQPDIATRRMLRVLSLQLRLPVVALTDCGSYGLSIFMVYLVGSGNMAYDSADLCTPNMRWLGVKPSDVETYKIPKNHVYEFSIEDAKMLSHPLWIDRVLSDTHLCKEYEIMKQCQIKFEVEDLNALGFSYLIDFYLMDQFGKIGQSSHLLFSQDDERRHGFAGVADLQKNRHEPYADEDLGAGPDR